MRFRFTSLIPLLLIFTGACSHTEADKQKIELQQSLEARIETLEDQIDVLEDRGEKLTGASKLALQAALEFLETQLERAKEEYDDLEEASAANVASLKKNVEEQMTQLDLAYSKALEIFAQ
jgi:TolA-binding protein